MRVVVVVCLVVGVCVGMMYVMMLACERSRKWRSNIGNMYTQLSTTTTNTSILCILYYIQVQHICTSICMPEFHQQ